MRPPFHSSPTLRGTLLVAAAALAAALVAPAFTSMHRGSMSADPRFDSPEKPASERVDAIFPGPGVTRETRLSEFFAPLAGTAGDTPVFGLCGARPGGAMLVLGGTHGDEPAGYLAAVVLVERARVEAGTLFVIPRANASGFTHNVPQEGHPPRFAVHTPRGPRWFTFGARATNPVHQWPDPQVYTLAGSGQTLSGSETRNLNRAYPGNPRGTLTERIAHAIVSLIRRERVDLACDLHEASPEYPVVNTIVAHQRATDLAALVNVKLQAEGVEIGLEASPPGLHGLSHREWGDTTGTLAVLMETTNPVQGRLRGRTGAAEVTGGRDRFYSRAAAAGRLSVPFPQDGWPLDVRVARHLAGIAAFASSLGELVPGREVTVAGVPDYATLVGAGLGAVLHAGGGE